MKRHPLNTLAKISVNAIVRSTEQLEGTASIIATLEKNADEGRVTPGELAGIPTAMKSCART